jgi:hypothetical protein
MGGGVGLAAKDGGVGLAAKDGGVGLVAKGGGVGLAANGGGVGLAATGGGVGLAAKGSGVRLAAVGGGIGRLSAGDDRGGGLVVVGVEVCCLTGGGDSEGVGLVDVDDCGGRRTCSWDSSCTGRLVAARPVLGVPPAGDKGCPPIPGNDCPTGCRDCVVGGRVRPFVPGNGFPNSCGERWPGCVGNCCPDWPG